jgi:hypothetical protein
MVAATGDRWQACAMLPRSRGSILIVLAAAASVTAAARLHGAPTPVFAQAPAPADAPDAPRTMAFSWTLYPKMWAELDLRLAAGADAVAEVTAEGGEITWNVHAHPNPESPATFVVLSHGVAGQASVPIVPGTPGFYSYLFENDKGAGPVRLRIDLRLRGDGRLEAVKP